MRTIAPWLPEQILCPVIVGFGSLSRDHHRAGAAWIADHVADGQVVEVEGARHGAHTSHPEAMVAMVRTALARLEADAP